MAAGEICNIQKVKTVNYIVENSNIEAALFMVGNTELTATGTTVRVNYIRTLQFYKKDPKPEMKDLSDSAFINRTCSTTLASSLIELKDITFAFKSSTANLINVTTDSNPLLILTNFKFYPDTLFTPFSLSSQNQSLYEGEPLCILS